MNHATSPEAIEFCCFIVQIYVLFVQVYHLLTGIGVPGAFLGGANNFFLPKLNPVLPKNILSGGAKFSNSVLPS